MDIAERVMNHRYAGGCPDSLDGWDRRDPECEACQALADVEIWRDKR